MGKFLRFGLLAAFIAALTVMVSCKDDKTNDEVPGVSGQNWPTLQKVAVAGEEFTYTFKAQAGWSAVSSDESWCKVLTPSGAAGPASLRLKIEPNETGVDRTVTVKISVEGFRASSFTVRQVGTDGEYAELNKWMADYMKSHYLWNSAVKTLQMDYSLGYEEFLAQILQGVAAQNDINHDDGHWENGKRKYFYSNIQRFRAGLSAAAGGTRGTRPTEEGTGIEYMLVYQFSGSNDCFIVLQGVAPGSPAEKAGLKRGTYIVKVNGSDITTSNYQSMANALTASSGTVKVTTATVSGNQLSPSKEDIAVTAGVYNDNPVWKTSVLTASNGDKVGYLCYSSFNYYYDDALIAAFTEFKAQGVKQLVLDLRYNGGGHVVSSTVLGTLVAGSAKTGQVYSHTTYNQERTQAGEESENYCIGTAEISSESRYQPIATALGSALGLNTVYILGTERTASASELVINGLRGLDIDVRLIGEKTNGKNVGMEPISKTLSGYEYEFSPITFYSENAKGWKDYSDGFTPDVAIKESDSDLFDWGAADDPLVAAALRWIGTGAKPAASFVAAPATRSVGVTPLKVIGRPGRISDMIILREEKR